MTEDDSGMEEDEVPRRRKRIRVISSSDEDEESSPTLERKRNVRRNLESDFSGGSSEARSSRNVREQRLQEMARRRNPRKYDSVNSDSEEEYGDENNDNESNDADNTFEEVTKIFVSKFSGPCQLDGCKEWFVKGITKIMGVKIVSRPKYKDKPHWICAKHSRFHSVPDEVEEVVEEEEEVDEDYDKDFIDDESQEESDNEDHEEEMAEITRRLSRSRPQDKENTERYLTERGKYQLEIHSVTNPGLHLSEEKRLGRNKRETRRDLGLNQERNIQAGDLENQRWADVSVGGRRVRVFPDLARRSRYSNTCTVCQAKIVRNRSWVVPALVRWRGRLELNSRQKAFYICASHVDNQQSDSD